MDDVKFINEKLREYPEQIYAATIRTEGLRESWQLTDARCAYEEAKAYLLAKANNVTEGQAKAQAKGVIYETTQSVIVAESAYRRALADQTRIENEFTATRKMAELLKLTEQHMGKAA